MIRLCSIWGRESTQWKYASFTWTECQLIQEVCAVWSTTPWKWKEANWLWSRCNKPANPQPPGVDATTLIPPWIEEPWNPYRAGELEREKRKRLIRLICKVKGQKFEEEKEFKNFRVTIEDIRMVVKAVANIDLDLKMEE